MKPVIPSSMTSGTGTTSAWFPRGTINSKASAELGRDQRSGRLRVTRKAVESTVPRLDLNSL
jgi:hypothetical protein